MIRTAPIGLVLIAIVFGIQGLATHSAVPLGFAAALIVLAILVHEGWRRR